MMYLIYSQDSNNDLLLWGCTKSKDTALCYVNKLAEAYPQFTINYKPVNLID